GLLVALLSAVLVGACSPPASPSGSPCTPGAASVVPTPASTAVPESGVVSPAAPAGSTASASFDPSGVSVDVAVAVCGFDSPVDVSNAGDGSGRLFVVEQAGRIRLVKSGAL